MEKDVRRGSRKFQGGMMAPLARLGAAYAKADPLWNYDFQLLSLMVPPYGQQTNSLKCDQTIAKSHEFSVVPNEN